MELTKGQPVTFNVIGIQPVAGTYVGPVKVSAKYPKGGHRVRVYNQTGSVVVKNSPATYATMDEALAVVAASYGR